MQYEYAHNPELFNHTRLAKHEQMRRTFQVGGTQSSTLLKAGSTTVGFNNSETPKSANEGVNPTSHWKSTYSGVVEESLAQPATRAQRPMWSLPR